MLISAIREEQTTPNRYLKNAIRLENNPNYEVMSSGGMNAGFDMNKISAISRPDPEEIFIISAKA